MMQEIGIAAFLVGLSVSLAIYAFIAPARRVSSTSYAQVPSFDESEGSARFDRYVKPMIRNILPQTPMDALLSKDKKNKINELLLRSGNPWRISAEEFVGAQLVFGLLAFIGTIIGWTIGMFEDVPVPGWVIVIFFSILCYYLPIGKHKSIIEARAKQIRKQLPEALDLMVISMSAGRSFETSLREINPSMPEGILREELRRVRLELDAGMSTEEALKNFARRSMSEESEAFAKAVIQANRLGASIEETLSNQAVQARSAYSALLEKKIARLEGTIFVPLIFTMVPALMITVLAPQAQIIMENL